MKNRKNNRLQRYDYSCTGCYFVTMCVQDRQEWLGKIEKEAMVLNEYGTIAAIHWEDIPKYYPNVELDEWVIMPNHIHGIIVISSGTAHVGTAQCAVPTDCSVSVKTVAVSQIIKSFKDVTIKRIRSEFGNVQFRWQRSFYDHIIRDESSVNRIREYIMNNPKQWDLDVENIKNRNDNPAAYYNNVIKGKKVKFL
jgi:putative transposase